MILLINDAEKQKIKEIVRDKLEELQDELKTEHLRDSYHIPFLQEDIRILKSIFKKLKAGDK